MARILFVYEFGAGLGHLDILIAIAKQFLGRHRLSFAVPDLPLAGMHLGKMLGNDITIYQAPVWSEDRTAISKNGTSCCTLAETLALFAFDDYERLKSACDTWYKIIEVEKPDVILADSAPTARLALGSRVPMVVVGTGFTILPTGRPLPPLRSWQTTVPPHSRAVEARICSLINRLRASAEGKCIDYLADLFRGDKTFISTLPEFDPYARYRNGEPYIPFTIPAIPPGPTFALRSGPTIFAYLPNKHPAVLAVIEALNRIQSPSQLFLSNSNPNEIAKLCRRHVRVHSVPAELSTLLPRCKLVVHHGGLGMTLAAMAAGTAQLTIPAFLENDITGIGLETIGSGIMVQVFPKPGAKDIISAIVSILFDRRVESKSLEAARRVESIRGDNLRDVVVKNIESYIT